MRGLQKCSWGSTLVGRKDCMQDKDWQPLLVRMVRTRMRIQTDLSAGESSGSSVCTRVTSFDTVYSACASAWAPQSSLGSARPRRPPHTSGQHQAFRNALKLCSGAVMVPAAAAVQAVPGQLARHLSQPLHESGACRCSTSLVCRKRQAWLRSG